MSDRREFMRQFLGGTTAMTASGLFPPSRVLGANDRVRIGLIGAGGRGTEILQAALGCKNVEAVAVADLYSGRLEAVKAIIPQAKGFSDYRQLLDDKSIDAVLIATPQHQHALNFVAAIQSGKDVYQEKTMAFNPDHARRMRRAFEGSGRVVQIGIQGTSGAAVEQAHEFLSRERMGTITQIHTHHYRNAPYGGWKRRIPADCDPQHVDWKAFEGEAALHPFDPNRFINWRFFWDYSGGNVFENMVHPVGFWYKLLNLQIPRSVTMTGGNYSNPEMEVPDTMDVSMDLQENLLFTWNSMFGNRYYGEIGDLVLGTKGTILRNEAGQVSYLPEGKPEPGEAQAQPANASGQSPDIVGGDDETVTHMQNFFDCVRNRKEPNCPFEIGFRSAIVCQMAIASYRQGKTVRWDPQGEGIV